MLEFKATTLCIVWWRNRPRCVKCPSICLAQHLLFVFFFFGFLAYLSLISCSFVWFFLFFSCCTSLPCWISHCTIVVCCCFALMLPLSPCWCSSPYLVVVIACSYSLLPWCYSSSRFYYFSSLCCYCCCLAIHPSTNIAFACHFVNVCSTKPSSLFGESFWLAFF